MNLTLVYHRVAGKGKYSNEKSLFKKHLHYIHNRYKCVHPGDLSPFSLLLSFDDATVDFFFTVFPLLQQMQLPCMLAVPTAKLLPVAELSAEKRLALLKKHPSNDTLPPQAYCSVEELKQMACSPLIEFACHTHSHIRCDQPIENFDQEILQSKQKLEKWTDRKVKSFVYPYGRLQVSNHRNIQSHFSYLFRIGSSYNLNWKHPHKLYFRLPADNLKHPKEPFRAAKKASCLGKLPLNYIKSLSTL